MDNYSIEMTARDVESLREASGAIPKKNGDLRRVSYRAKTWPRAHRGQRGLVKSLGFTPVPHISARRLLSHEDLTTFLSRLQTEGRRRRTSLFVVAG